MGPSLLTCQVHLAGVPATLVALNLPKVPCLPVHIDLGSVHAVGLQGERVQGGADLVHRAEHQVPHDVKPVCQ